MYQAVELANSDRYFHCFVWRLCLTDSLMDYRMTRLTFDVYISASSFAAIMSLKQNAFNFAMKYTQAAQAVHESFCVDDSLTGADAVEEAVELQSQLQDLFSCGGFLLRKWNSSDQRVLKF